MDAIERRRRASAEAADWWARVQLDDATRTDREQFVDWLWESPTHVEEMLRMAEVHEGLRQFQRWMRVAADERAPEVNIVALPVGVDSLRDTTRRARRRGKWLGALAAAVVVLALAAMLVLPGFRGQSVATERGERREVVLSDGSVVQVDPETRLQVRFEEQSRHVVLETGRALFHVAKDAARPFVVQADDVVARAVGTAFGVELDHGNIVVTVAEGTVAVIASEASHSSPAQQQESARQQFEVLQANPAADAVNEILLTANQQVTLRRSGHSEPVRKVDSDRELAWAEGKLVFDNDTVSTVIEEFNRYNRVQLRVSDETLAARPISGLFSASDPEALIAFIQAAAPVQVTRGSGVITISPQRDSMGAERDK